MAKNEQVVEGARLSGEGALTGKLVRFKRDLFPHVAGDIKRISEEEEERLAEAVKSRDFSKSELYVEHKLSDEEKEAVKRDNAAGDESDEDSAKKAPAKK